MLERYEYIKTFRNPEADLRDRVKDLLLVNGRPKTCGHVFTVARKAAELSDRFGENTEQAVQASLLHDISAVIRPADMLARMEEQGGYLDDAERAHPFLLHQRISRIIAAEDFLMEDDAVLSAIEVHTTLRSAYSTLDLIVYLADKLAWDQPGDPPWKADLEAALAISPEHAALTHIDYVMTHGMILHPHRWLLEAREALRNNTGGAEQ